MHSIRKCIVRYSGHQGEGLLGDGGVCPGMSAQGSVCPGGCLPRVVSTWGCLPRAVSAWGCLPRGVSAQGGTSRSIPLFWLLVTSLDFKARVGSTLFALGGAYVIYVPWDSPLVPHLLPVYTASIAASRLPHMHVSAEVECRDLNCRPPARQSDALPTRPLSLFLVFCRTFHCLYTYKNGLQYVWCCCCWIFCVVVK